MHIGHCSANILRSYFVGGTSLPFWKLHAVGS